MHILRNYFFAVFLSLCFVTSCSPLAPLTPESAYSSGITAVKSNSSGMLYSLLSSSDIRRIESAVRLFSTMDDAQIRKLGEHYGIAPERLRKFTVNDYPVYYISAGPEINMIKKGAAQKIITVDVSGSTAIIRFESGMFLRFVKEGPYWKFDIMTL